MTSYSPIAGLPLPEANDLLVAERAFGDYASAVDTLLIPQYTTVAARNTAMNSGKITGQLCAVAGELQWWDGSTWWNFGDTRYAFKSVDTVRTSTATPTPDPHLTITLTTGRWLVECHTYWTCAVTTVNVQAHWDSSGGTITGSRCVVSCPAGTTDRNNSLSATVSPALGTSIATGALASSVVRMETVLVDVGAASDTLRFNWAQAASSASGLTLAARSHISYRMVSSA